MMTKLQRLNKEAALKELERKGVAEVALGLWPEDYCGCEHCYQTLFGKGDEIRASWPYSGVVVKKVDDVSTCLTNVDGCCIT